MTLLVGIFVGGRGSRMGGVAKGLLQAPDTPKTLLERLLDELANATPGAEIVLVGEADPYRSFGLASVADDPPHVGPLGGLLGLLGYASARGATLVLALACDLPRLSRHVLARLASEQPQAHALVATLEGVRNPLLARYRVQAALPQARRVLSEGTRSLQAVLDALAAETLVVDAAETATLGDWDTPEDIRRGS